MVDPLDDLTVLELSQMLAGPYAGMNLADLGADVVKVEQPKIGEISRRVEPKVGGESYYYTSVNRNKRSLTLDLKSDDGRQVFLDLAAQADVILENFTPGTSDRLGIGYDSVRKVNPEILYCSISGFGQSGPLAEAPAVGHVIQAYTGVMSMTRDTDGRPLRFGLPISDLAGAMHAVQSILAALRRRDKTGEGDYLDVALSDSMLSFLSIRAGYTHATGEPFPDISRSHVYFAPEAVYPTDDGHVQVSIVTEDQWKGLCRAIDRPELRDDPKYRTESDRLNHHDELNTLLEETLEGKTTEFWISRFREYDVPASQVNDTRSVWDDEHVQSRHMLTDVATPEGESLSTSSYPVKHRSWSLERGNFAAALGEHTDEILQELDYSDDEIAGLHEENII